MPDVPAEMDALVADAPVAGTLAAVAKLRVARVPVPAPARGQVLVRIHAAPCNPADLYYLEGRYGIDRPLPATPGFEGAGTVVAAGGGMLARWLVGKRVACGGHESTGTWAEYARVDATACLPLRKELTLEQGATALANPITALALVAVMRAGRHRAYVQTGAAGQLGKMIRAIAHARGLAGIHVVRRAAQADALRALGARHVLVSGDAGFDAALAARCRELGATVALDAVAGAMTGQLVSALGRKGEVIVYGALGGEPCGAIDPMVLAFQHKRVRGFEIAEYLRRIGLFASIRLANRAQKLVATGVAPTTVRGSVALADAPSGLASYVTAMSEGKLLIVPGVATGGEASTAA
jgi:NADPH:quinone reductase-like Zn-dependent oxidoreductase